MRGWQRRWHLVSPTLYIIIVYRVNLNKLSRNFVGVLRTTTNNCRVSFIDLYLVFPRNFRIVSLPHTNTVILLEPYCGTITEPGLPVIKAAKSSTLCTFRKGREGLRPMESKADLPEKAWRIFPINLTGDVTSEIAEDHRERG